MRSSKASSLVGGGPYDGGIRSGQDVLKAWAMGARGTLVGRAAVYGLAALGEAGVTRGLEIIRNELDITMAFCGKTRLQDVDGSVVWREGQQQPIVVP